MKMDPKKLKEILDKNPQVDGDFVAKVLKEAEEIQSNSEGMVNFNIKLPYSSDNFDRAFQNSWNVI